MKTVKQILTAAMFLSGLLFYSCQKDTYDISLDPDEKNLRPIEINAPIAKVNVEMKRWLDSLIVDGKINVFGKNDVAEEGVLYVEFKHTEPLEWEELKSIRDVSRELSFPVSGLISGTQTRTENIKLISRNDAEYESITLASGYLGFDLEIPSGLEGEIKFEIPELTIAGQPYIRTISFPNTTHDYTHLTNGIIRFKETNKNSISLKSTITVRSYNNTSGNLRIGFTFEDLDVQSAEGYFGQVSVVKSDNEFGFGIFDELSIEYPNHFVFGNIILDAYIENHIGVPFEIKAGNIRSYKNDSFLESMRIDPDNHITLNTTSALENGTAGKGSFTVSNSNSNIESLVSRFPDKITFDLNGISNKNADPASTKNFIGRDDMTDINLLLKFPFHFRSSSYERIDTISFDAVDMFGDVVESASDVHFFDLTFKCVNRLPFDAGFTLYVVDKYGNVIDNLYKGENILKAVGSRNEAKESDFTVSLSGKQIINFIDKEVTRMILRTNASTLNNGSELVKIYDDSGLNINVSLKGKVNIPSNF